MDSDEKVQAAIDFAIQYGGFDGGHHKAWCLDQVVRVLSGENYDNLIKEFCEGEDGPDTYDWDVGIPP